MLLSKAEATARKILGDAGIHDLSTLTSIELKTIVQSRGAYYEEVDLDGKDGRIITSNDRSVISISNKILDPGKKRFTLAHELGHYELHKHLSVNADTQFELCQWFQSGNHEKEANEFAAELLMPFTLFRDACKGHKFSPNLIDLLSKSFITTKIATLLRFLKVGNHPICVVCIKDNKVKWWKMSQEMESAEHELIPSWTRYKMRITSNLPPPIDSVAGQLLRTKSSLNGFELFQEIEKSTWFLTHPKDNPPMLEYCHFVPSYNFALSVIWED